MPLRHRRPAVALLAVVTGLALAVSGCGRASPAGPTSAAPATSPVTPSSRAVTTPPVTASPSPTLRPTAANDVSIDGVDPCALVTASARSARGITTEDPDEGRDAPGSRGRSCGFGTGASTEYPGWGVQLWPSTPLETFRTVVLAGATDLTIGGFGAVSLVEGGPGTNNLDVVCSVAVSIAPDQTVLARSTFAAVTGGAAACTDARDLTTAVLAALVALN